MLCVCERGRGNIRVLVFFYYKIIEVIFMSLYLNS